MTTVDGEKSRELRRKFHGNDNDQLYYQHSKLIKDTKGICCLACNIKFCFELL